MPDLRTNNEDLEAALINGNYPQTQHYGKWKTAATVACCVLTIGIIAVPIVVLTRYKDDHDPMQDYPGTCPDGYQDGYGKGSTTCADNYPFDHRSYQFMREYLANNATIVPGNTLKATCCPANNASKINHICCDPSPYQDFRYFRISQVIPGERHEYDIRWMIAKDMSDARKFFQDYFANATSYTGMGPDCLSKDETKDSYCAMNAIDEYRSIYPQEEPWKNSSSTAFLINKIEMKRWWHDHLPKISHTADQVVDQVSKFYNDAKKSVSSLSIFAIEAKQDEAERPEPQNPKLVM